MARRVRWRGAIAAALVLAGAGIWAGNGTLLLAATLPFAYVAYGTVSTVQVPEQLVVSRTIESSPAPPGQAVSVRLVVENGTDRTVSDVRVVDGVPEDLAVVDGSPRGAGTLAPGESLVVTYTLVARRGEFDFDPPRVRIRGTGAGAVATAEPVPAGDARLVCRLDADAPPLADEGNERVGRLTTDDPGEGLSFHSTREYQPGDPASRIDWRHYAKKGELATVNYERWVSTTVVFVVDARNVARVAAGPGRPTAVELGAYATTQAMTSLLRSGHDVAVAVVGVAGSGPADLAWLPPEGGREQRSRAISMLGNAIDAGAASPGAGSPGSRGPGPPAMTVDPRDQFKRVAELAGPRSQLVLVSPVLDDLAVEAVEAWAPFDHPRTVLSPDVVAGNTVSGQYEQVRRRTRLAECQAAGARTIDWRRGTPLSVVLEHAFTIEAHRPDGRTRPGGGVT